MHSFYVMLPNSVRDVIVLVKPRRLKNVDRNKQTKCVWPLSNKVSRMVYGTCMYRFRILSIYTISCHYVNISVTIKILA